MKKFLPYIFIVLILVGLFGATGKVEAQSNICVYDALGEPTNAPCVNEFCWDNNGDIYNSGISENNCYKAGFRWGTAEQYGNASNQGKGVITNNTNAPQTEFEKAVARRSCGIGLLGSSASLQGCILQIVYYVFYMLGAGLLYVSGYFFNVMMTITLSSSMLQSSFIATGWAIVRDLSNLFFILILLYIAVKVILDIGAHEAKKTIAQVVIMALLINFSMFMTEVVIDTSNIVALIFYNKIDTRVTNSQGDLVATAYGPVSGLKEKDISGGIVAAFDPTTLISEGFFKSAQDIPLPGTTKSFSDSSGPPTGLLILMAVMAGGIMLFAAWALFVSSLSFLGRLIELFVLIIFSPFAFMSSALPILGHVEYIGWEHWLKRLFKLSFMAPIFMFFLYFIFLLVNANIFQSVLNQDPQKVGFIITILRVVLPALLILILLMRATKYAKEGSGTVGEVIFKTVGIATGIAGGLAIGGIASAGQATLGHVGKNIFENKGLAEAELKGNFFTKRIAKKIRTVAGGDDGKGGLAGSSFDARKGIAGGALKIVSGATGLNLGDQSKLLLKESGGYEADLKRRDEKRKKRAAGLAIKEGEEEKQTLNTYEVDHQKVSLQNHDKIHELDEGIKSAEANRESYRNVKGQEENFEKHANEVIRLRAERSGVKNGGEIIDPVTRKGTGEYRTHNGNISRDEVAGANLRAIESGTEKIKAEKALAEAEQTRTSAVQEEATAINNLRAAERADVNARNDLARNPTNPIAIDTANAAAKALAEAKTKSENATKKLVDITQDYANTEVRLAKTAEISSAADAQAKRANDAAQNLKPGKNGKREFGNSQNNYEDVLLPHQKHVVEEVSKGKARVLATNIENERILGMPKFWSKAARRKSAHEIRMGAKPPADKGGHGGHNLAGHVAADIAGGAIANLLTGPHGSTPSAGGSKGNGGPAPTAGGH